MLTRALCAAALAALVALPVLAQTAEPRVAVPKSGTLWGSAVAIENVPCCAPGAGQPGIAKAEAQVLEHLQNWASRDGPVLRLRLGGNRSLNITDFPSPGGADFRAHSLLAWWPRQGYYLVQVQYEDGAATWLIRQTDGLTVLLFGQPVLSPDGWRAVAPAYGASGEVGSVDLVELRANPPDLPPIALGPSCVAVGLKRASLTPRWTDNATVEFGAADFILGRGTAALRVSGDKAEWECQTVPGSGEKK